MSEYVELTAKDGQELSAYVARPSGSPHGAVLIVQEIFGVNAQIRAFADRIAAAGYLAIAPALFDRHTTPKIELGYQGADLQAAFSLYKLLSPETALLDVEAAGAFALASGVDSVAVIGFCFGGLMSWLSATRGAADGMPLRCAVGYYPGGVGNVATESPTCPVMLHFGNADSHIGPEQREAVAAAHPEVEICVYDQAQHGFAGTERAEYLPAAAELAWSRTLSFLQEHLNG